VHRSSTSVDKLQPTQNFIRVVRVLKHLRKQEQRGERLLPVSHKLALFLTTLLSGVALVMVLAVSGGKASAMPVPGSGTWDTALTGVIEELDEVSPQGDTHLIVQDGNSFPIQSDVLDLSSYVGEEVTVYIRTLPLDDGSEILDVIDVGPAESFSAAKA
jgi:hypothetical protein